MPVIARAYKDTDADLAAIQAALMGWVAQTGDGYYCHPGDVAHRIYNGLRNKFSLPDVVTIWEDAGTIVAFSISYPKKAVAFFDAFVHPEYRDAIEAQVIEQAEKNLLTHATVQVEKMGVGALSTDVRRAEILSMLGYERGEAVIRVTTRDLGDNLPDYGLPDGYSIRSATMEDVERLMAVHSSAFNSDWTHEEYAYVMQSPGYDPAREIVVVAPDGSFAAFCIYWLDTVNKVGLFEPVGTHADHRRKGLARALMVHTMQVMRDSGMQAAHVAHEIKNDASTNLYASLGFVSFADDVDYMKVVSEAE